MGRRTSTLSAKEGWDRIKEYIQDQDNTWNEPYFVTSIPKILQKLQPTFETA